MPVERQHVVWLAALGVAALIGVLGLLVFLRGDLANSAPPVQVVEESGAARGAGRGPEPEPGSRVPLAHAPAAGHDAGRSEREVGLRVRRAGGGLPVSGATLGIWIRADDGPARFGAQRVTTDREGLACILAPLGDARLGYELNDLRGQRLDGHVPCPAGCDQVELFLPAPALVVGVVVARGTGEALGGITVRHAGSADGALTDAAGRFGIECGSGSRVSLEAIGDGMGPAYAQVLEGMWVEPGRHEVVIELDPSIRVHGRLENTAGREFEVAMRPMGRLGLDPGAEVRAPVGRDGRFEFRSSPRGMGCLFRVLHRDAPLVEWTWRGAGDHTDLGVIRLPDLCELEFRRSQSLADAGEILVRAAWHPLRDAQPSAGGTMGCQQTWIVAAQEQVFSRMVPEGVTRLTGRCARCELVEVEVHVPRQGGPIVLEPMPTSVWRIDARHRDGSVRSGMITLMDGDGRRLELVAIGLAGSALIRRTPRAAVARILVTEPLSDGWRTRRFQDVGSDGDIAIARGDRQVAVRGMLVAPSAGTTWVRLRGRGAGRTVEYECAAIRTHIAWGTSVESGLDYEVEWGEVTSLDRPRSERGGRLQLGVLDADRFVVLDKP